MVGGPLGQEAAVTHTRWLWTLFSAACPSVQGHSRALGEVRSAGREGQRRGGYVREGEGEKR